MGLSPRVVSAQITRARTNATLFIIAAAKGIVVVARPLALTTTAGTTVVLTIEKPGVVEYSNSTRDPSGA